MGWRGGGGDWHLGLLNTGLGLLIWQAVPVGEGAATPSPLKNKRHEITQMEGRTATADRTGSSREGRDGDEAASPSTQNSGQVLQFFLQQTDSLKLRCSLATGGVTPLFLTQCPLLAQHSVSLTLRVTLLVLPPLYAHTLAPKVASFQEPGRKCRVFFTEGAGPAARIISSSTRPKGGAVQLSAVSFLSLHFNKS